jgi:hypothetical protein
MPNNAEPTTRNPAKNRGSNDVMRHFPGLGILTKMPHSAFSSPIRCENSDPVVSLRPRRRTPPASFVDVPGACSRGRHLLVPKRLPRVDGSRS